MVREAAVERITDQAALAQLVRQDTEPRVRRAAVARAHAQGHTLERVALQDADPEACRLAAWGLIDLLADAGALGQAATRDADPACGKRRWKS